MSKENCTESVIFTKKLLLVFAILIQLPIAFASQSTQEKRKSAEISQVSSNENLQLYSKSVNSARLAVESIFTHEQAKKKRRGSSGSDILTQSDQENANQFGNEFLKMRGLLKSDDTNLFQLHNYTRKILQEEASNSNISLTPELDNAAQVFANDMFSKLLNFGSVFSQAGGNKGEIADTKTIIPDYENLIEDRDFVGLIKRLHLEATIYITPTRQSLENFTLLLENSKPLSVSDVESHIEKLRKFISYGFSVEDILALHTHLLKLSDSIESICGSLQESVLYKPWPNQSVTDALLGYVFLPHQYDHGFESNASLALRAPIIYLTALSALHKNVFAINKLMLFRTMEEDETSFDEKILKLHHMVEQTDYDDLQRPLFYHGLDLLERLERSISLRFLLAAANAGDLRGAYEYLFHSKETDEKLLERLAEGSPSFACLLMAENSKDAAQRKKYYEASGISGIAYSYIQMARMCLKSDKKTEALKYYCLAFEKGHYSAHQNIYDLCSSLNTVGDEFSLEYKKLCDTFVGDSVDDAHRKKLNELLLHA